MKLKTFKIKNFRCYRDEFSIDFDSLTAIIAKNDAGKSSIFEALDAFFNLDKLDSDDRSSGAGNADPIELTCIFDSIPTSLIVDTDNIISPHHEHLLNSIGLLEIKKTFIGASPKCEDIYLLAIHPTAENYSDLFALTIANLRIRARQLGIDLTNINTTIKSALRHAIWSSVDDAMLQKQEISIEIKNTIWKSLQNTLPLFQLFKSDRPSSDQDAEAQDPIKFAIKEALAAKSAELEVIGNHVRQQVFELTRATIEKLREMDPSLANELNPNFSALNWTKVFSVSLTNEGQVPLNKRGSGVRRLFLINFFRAKAEQLSAGRSVNDVIFAIEEPETSQHPNNQILLLEAIQELSEDPSNQVMFTTHNPILAGKINSNSVRFIQKREDGVRFIAPNNDNTLVSIRKSLGIFANHKIKIFIGVEGPNDIEFLNRISESLAATEADIPNLRNAEASGLLVYIPMGGSTLELWSNRLEGLNLPEIHIMDRDNIPPLPARYQAAADRINARGANCAGFTTTMREMENYLHFCAINEEFGITLTPHNAFDDVPRMVAEAVHSASESEIPWHELEEDKKKKKESLAKKRLNRGASSRMTAERLTESDTSNEVRSWLRAINVHLT